MEILKDENFALLMRENAKKIVDFLLFKAQDFKIVARFDFVSFEPDLPKNFKANFKDFILFELANYTLESAEISGESLTFHAGFGEDNFESIVKIPFAAISQIIVKNSVIFINIAQIEPPKNDSEKLKELFKKSIN